MPGNSPKRCRKSPPRLSWPTAPAIGRARDRAPRHSLRHPRRAGLCGLVPAEPAALGAYAAQPLAAGADAQWLSHEARHELSGWCAAVTFDPDEELPGWEWQQAIDEQRLSDLQDYQDEHCN